MVAIQRNVNVRVVIIKFRGRNGFDRVVQGYRVQVNAKITANNNNHYEVALAA